MASRVGRDLCRAYPATVVPNRAGRRARPALAKRVCRDRRRRWHPAIVRRPRVSRGPRGRGIARVMSRSPSPASSSSCSSRRSRRCSSRPVGSRPWHWSCHPGGRDAGSRGRQQPELLHRSRHRPNDESHRSSSAGDRAGDPSRSLGVRLVLAAASLALMACGSTARGRADRIRDRLLRLRLHHRFEAPHGVQHRVGRYRRVHARADRVGGRHRLAGAGLRCCCSWWCSGGRHRTFGRWPCVSGTTTPQPASQCCRWSPSRASSCVGCSAIRGPWSAASLLLVAGRRHVSGLRSSALCARRGHSSRDVRTSRADCGVACPTASCEPMRLFHWSITYLTLLFACGRRSTRCFPGSALASVC